MSRSALQILYAHICIAFARTLTHLDFVPEHCFYSNSTNMSHEMRDHYQTRTPRHANGHTTVNTHTHTQLYDIFIAVRQIDQLRGAVDCLNTFCAVANHNIFTHTGIGIMHTHRHTKMYLRIHALASVSMLHYYTRRRTHNISKRARARARDLML